MASQQNDVGRSIAKLYDSPEQLRAGAELTDREIVLTHDMGQQVFAERHRVVHRQATFAVAQSTAFDQLIDGLPEQFQVLGVQVTVDTNGAIANLAVHAENEGHTLSNALFYWESAGGSSTVIRVAPGGDTNVLLPSAVCAALFPNRNLVLSRNTREATGGIALAVRGTTTAFGAGNVTITARLLLAFFNRQNSTMPLGAVAPFPSW